MKIDVRTVACTIAALVAFAGNRSEEHTSELQSLRHLVCRLLLEKKKSRNFVETSARFPPPRSVKIRHASQAADPQTSTKGAGTQTSNTISSPHCLRASREISGHR